MSALYTVVSEPLAANDVDTSSLKTLLEKGTDEDRIRAMRQVVSMTIAGDNLPHLLMDIIRFVLPSKNKQLKKLLHAYWEVVPKHDDKGKLRQEMILVVNAIRNDLQHPNEYIRGGTLRFLTKFREAELLDPLVPTIRQCLEHRHAYVRKNAAFCVLGIAQYEATEHLIPDAAELLYAFLANESDATCKHNAFVALTRLDRQSAYAYFHSQYANIASADEMLQLAFIQFAAKDALSKPELADSYVQILQGWLDQVQTGSSSTAVAYGVASALSKLSNDPTVLSEVAATYIDIAVRESDNNVKVTVLNRVSALAEDDSFSHLVMDILLILSTQDIAVRSAVLKLALKLVSSRSVDQVLRLLKKELANSLGQKYDSVDEYRHAIIDTIHELALKFKDFAGDVVSLLLEFLSELSTTSALEVISFAKEVVEFYPEKRSSVILQLSEALHSIRSSRAHLSTLWVLGEYAVSTDELNKVWGAIMEALGPVPFDNGGSHDEQASIEQITGTHSTKPRVLADGTYATESPLEVAAAAAAAAERSESHHLRKLLLEGDYFLGGVLAAALSKLAIRYSQCEDVAVTDINKRKAEALLIMSSMLRTQSAKINDDAFDRIYGCINILIQGSNEAQQTFLEKPHDAFSRLQRRNMAAKNSSSLSEQSVVRVEQPVKFRLFSKLDGVATKHVVANKKKTTPIVSNTNQSQLKQVTQLTGYSDPVYVEALMTVSQFDIILDVMVFNQTNETLQNMKVEFFTTGELKVIDSPATVNLAPLSFHTCRVTIRVSSVDSATIFGDICYDGKQKLSVVLLNDIRLNIIDYIRPESCSESEFRSQWVKFEWENKVPVQNTTAKSLSKYLEMFMKRTNMSCLTEGSGEEDSNFLSANLYARSCFGEVVLANLSAELTSDGVVSGHVRVRAKQKGAAVSVGDCVVTI